MELQVKSLCLKERVAFYCMSAWQVFVFLVDFLVDSVCIHNVIQRMFPNYITVWHSQAIIEQMWNLEVQRFLP